MDGHFPRLATLVAALALVLTPAAARADLPAARWPAGGSTLRAALALGAEHWGMQPCRGKVAVSWTSRLRAPTNAQSSWANATDPYLQPSFNTDCSIALSLGTDWDWPKLCTVVIHEVGHLTGHDHVDDPTDIMYYAYLQPAPECTATPEPVETGPPTPPPPAPATAAKPPAAPRAAATKKPKAPPKRKRAHRSR
ncbi:MAG TPA: matrixin family metalloprotease [Baekduia sp.]